MDLNLSGNYAVISGGAKGIGSSIVKCFVNEGVNVAIIDIDSDAAEYLLDNLDCDGVNTVSIEADLTNPDACQFAIKQVLKWSNGKLDILVNNAGVNDSVDLTDGPKKFQLSLDRNLVHTYCLVHYALNALKESNGSILNISSKVAQTGQGGTSGYAASKGAINGLTREWAVDLAPYGIRVNAIAPAEVMTPLYKSWIESLPEPEETLNQIQDQIPLGHRMTTKEEIADLATFLVSPKSSHTTGQIFNPDGGYVHLDRSCTSSISRKNS
ncbi:MAG: SDR family oxidoreductase [Opitutae bacterium]|nr:SDR family oxidoreductase [Opitutae bacterium]